MQVEGTEGVYEAQVGDEAGKQPQLQKTLPSKKHLQTFCIILHHFASVFLP